MVLTEQKLVVCFWVPDKNISCTESSSPVCSLHSNYGLCLSILYCFLQTLFVYFSAAQVPFFSFSDFCLSFILFFCNPELL